MTINTPAGTAPSPAGGTVTDGTYYLTAMNVYGNPPGVSGATAQEVVQISNLVVELSEQDSVYGTNQLKATATLNSTKGTFAPICGANALGNSFGYTANGNTLRLYFTVKVAILTFVFEQVLTKQ